jgi:hypothetical protein
VGSSPVGSGDVEASMAAPWHPALVRWPDDSGEQNSKGFAPTGPTQDGELT